MTPRLSPSVSAARTSIALVASELPGHREDVFRALVSHTPVGVFVSDSSGGCVYVNRRWCELTGMSPDEALGDGWTKALHPEDAARVQGEWVRASQEGCLSVVEYRFLRSDGRVASIEGFASPVRDERGRLTGWVGTCVDLTARKQAEAAAARADDLFHEAFDNAPVGVALITPDGHYSWVNRALCDLLGYTSEEMRSKTFLDMTHPDDVATNKALHRRQLEGGIDEIRLEKRYIRADGGVVWASVSSTLVRDAIGQPSYSVTVIDDISERVRARQAQEEAEERFRRAFDDAPIGMAIVATDGRFLRVNETMAEITGYPTGELLDLTFQDITYPEDLAADVEQVESVLCGEIRSYQMEKRYVRRDGSTVWVILSVSLVRDADGAPLHFISQVQDISERKQHEAELQRLANFDPLTGLGNRRKLIADLGELLAPAAVPPFGLAIYDLNGFKTYNDMFGHPSGDTMLERLSQALTAAVGDAGSVYRIGGDEFCVVATHDPESVFAAARAALSVRGEWFAIEAECGFVHLPTEAGDISSALQLADARLYGRKGSARRTAPQQARDALMQVLQEQDPDLSGHATRVAELAEATARTLGLDDEEVWHVRLAAELHDVGKAAVPELLLDKPGALDEAEWSFIKRHTLIGERIVGAAPALARVGYLIRASHERLDGRGYPDGLEGEEIPVGARIVAVADAFDAMTSERPYASARAVEQAIDELRRCAGTQFDPGVVEAFVEAASSAPVPASAESESQGSAPIASRSTAAVARLERALERARSRHWERPLRAAAVAKAVARRALERGDSGLYGRALVLEAQVETRHGRLDRAFELLEAARAETKRSGLGPLRAELALAQSRLSFLAGLYDEALAQAEEAVVLADTYRLDDLRIVTRQGRTLVLGAVDPSHRLPAVVKELLELTIELGNRKEEALARNDLAFSHLADGDVAAAREEIEHVIRIARELGPRGLFALAYGYSTRAEIFVAAGEPELAIADCDRSLELADAADDPEPYLTAMTIHTKLDALIGSDRLDEALEVGRRELERLEQDLPHARSRILRTLGDALRRAGRLEEAYDAMQESADLDRTSFEQLSDRQLNLQRASLEAQAARHEAQLLAAKNEQLEELLAEIELVELRRLGVSDTASAQA